MTVDLDKYIYNQPHLLVYGDVGTGKRQMVKSFLSKKYPDKEYKNSVHWIYCFDGKNQKELLNIIKRIGNQIYKPSVNTKINHRVIVLDGLEFISYQCQASLRRCIEIFSKQTRFIFIGNHYGNIMKPIQSRCVFIHKTLPKENTVQEIAKLFGKRNKNKEMCTISLHSLDKTYKTLGTQRIECKAPFKKEYDILTNQVKWLNNFMKCKRSDCTLTEQARKWINNGWSILDLLAWIMWETKLWIVLYDINGLQKMINRVWKGISREERVELWDKCNRVMRGQHHEIFWTAWILGELRLIQQE